MAFCFSGPRAGCAAPFHTDFEEVNLRFYVRRRAPDGWRRGVVFIKEIVPRRLIATVARARYNEPYSAMPMRHRVEVENGDLRHGGLVEYAWRYRGRVERDAGRNNRRAAFAAGEFQGGIHHRALLWLHRPARRRMRGIPSGTSALERVAGAGGGFEM